MADYMKANRAVSSLIRDEMEKRSLTQESIAKTIERKSQSYVSDRLASKRSWSIDELDKIAPLVGFPNALTLISAAYTYRE